MGNGGAPQQNNQGANVGVYDTAEYVSVHCHFASGGGFIHRYSSTGYAPLDVDKEAAMVIRERMIHERRTQGTQCFSIEDYARLSKKKQTFKKGFETNFPDEIFKVVKVSPKGGFLILSL